MIKILKERDSVCDDDGSIYVVDSIEVDTTGVVTLTMVNGEQAMYIKIPSLDLATLSTMAQSFCDIYKSD